MSWAVLTGFMGAGKSTIGRAAATARGIAFVDSDERIEQQEGTDIPTIFATKGELWFRRMEERVIREVVEQTPAGILSIGGGAIESAKTRDLLSRTAGVVYLRAEPALLWQRVVGSDRPLATDEARFTRRFRRREPLYEEAADLVLDASQPREQVLAQLLAWDGTPG